MSSGYGSIITADLSLSSTNMVANLDLSSIWEPEDSGYTRIPQRACGNIWPGSTPEALLVISVLVMSFPSAARADAAGPKAALCEPLLYGTRFGVRGWWQKVFAVAL